MKIEEVITNMSPQYLGRIVDSFSKYKEKGEEKLRDQIRKAEKFAEVDNIKQRLDLENMDKNISDVDRPRILTEIILKKLLESSNHSILKKNLHEQIIEFEKELIGCTENLDLSKFLNKEKIERYESLLNVAFNNNELSSDEYKLLERYRKDQDINKKLSRYIEARLDKYPRPSKKGDKKHPKAQIDKTLTELQKKGIIFEENKVNRITIPDELIEGVKKSIGYEMSKKAHMLLLNKLNLNQLKSIAKDLNLRGYSIKKDKLKDKIFLAGYKPSEELSSLNNKDLRDIFGTYGNNKDEIIKKIINYYDQLELKETKSEDPRAKYYTYLEDLASREYDSLRKRGVINKDKMTENYFEDGTRYLFEKILGQKLLKFKDNEHPDGVIKFQEGELLMWDNKSTEEEYYFPTVDYNQFKKYINNSKERVKVFLIVGQQISSKAEVNARELKNDITRDTDIALISAENLKCIAKKWKDHKESNSEFNLKIFNITGKIEEDHIEHFFSNMK